MRIVGVLLASILAPVQSAMASPACVKPGAANFVLASSASTLTEGWGGEWLLQNVDNPSGRIFLRRCSEAAHNTCYFATDVKPGKYYFREAVPEGKNDLLYPVSTEQLWFMITGSGVDYLGHWVIERPDLRIVKHLEIHYELTDLDKMLAMCEIKEKKLYLDRTKTAPSQIDD
jgi:hypothetical protein